MEDLCNSTKLPELVSINNSSRALICSMPKEQLASLEKAFQDNMDFIKPFMVSMMLSTLLGVQSLFLTLQGYGGMEHLIHI